jgi:predicted nucleotidyltransferase
MDSNMKPSDRKILKQFAERVRAIFPEARIWAFGSRARGDADVSLTLENAREFLHQVEEKLKGHQSH